MRIHCARERINSTQVANHTSSCLTAYVDDIANAVYVATPSLLSKSYSSRGFFLPLQSLLAAYAINVDRVDISQHGDSNGCFIQPGLALWPLNKRCLMKSRLESSPVAESWLVLFVAATSNHSRLPAAIQIDLPSQDLAATLDPRH